LYGLLAYTVARRIPEFGIRLALGASRGAVIRMVLRDAMTMVGVGVIVGALAANLIPGVSGNHGAPVIFGILAILAAALLAALVPAVRAAQADPAAALRHNL